MKLNKKIIERLKEEAREYFKGASGCHDWTHVERVRTLALKIGKKEKANLLVLEAAAFLHDIGRKKEMKKKGSFCHAEKGAEIAKRMLQKYNLDKETRENVLHCILTHRYRNNHIPKTIEAECLFDADKIDSIGAVGIGRDFLFAGFAGSKSLYTGNEKRLCRSKKDLGFTEEDSAVLEYEVKLKHIKDKVLTKTGKKIAKERSDYMDNFFKRFWQEVAGKK